MLKLIRCEMRKLKRKHFVSFVIFAALLFPIPFTALVLAGSVANFTGFEAVFGLLVTLGIPIMLPAITGIVAAMLFFMERDNDTLKNLRVIPVSPVKIVTAKILVLYILGLIFALATLASSMVGGIIAGSELTNIGEKLWVAIVTALLYTTSIMPAPIIYRWQATKFVEAGTTAYTVMEPYFLPLWLVVLTVVIIGALSYLAIVRIYSKRES